MFKFRNPHVSDILYESVPSLLKEQIGNCFTHKLGPKGMKFQKFTAGIVPDSSIASSGPVAAWTYSRLGKSNFIILGAAHKPIKTQFVMMQEGFWKTPLGELVIDVKMANRIADLSDLINYDAVPHETEHSVEVQMPFLQYMFGNDFKFVPILIYNQFADDNFLNTCNAVGGAIADAIKSSKDKWSIIATSDLTSRKKFDNKIIGHILKLRGEEMFSVLKETETKICGFGGIATAIAAAKNLNAKNSKLLKYAKASEISPTEAQAGYASIIIY